MHRAPCPPPRTVTFMLENEHTADMEWLDVHAGSVQAMATLVLVILTGYYAWSSRALVKETHATLQATARMTLATFEEAYAQRNVDSAMSEEDWRAWVATMDSLMS